MRNLKVITTVNVIIIMFWLFSKQKMFMVLLSVLFTLLTKEIKKARRSELRTN